MSRATVFGASLTLASLAAISSQAAPSGSPEAFVRDLYAQYVPHANPTAFAYPDGARIVDSTMLALLRHDQEMSKGEVGAMDGDPICQCQDWNRIKIQSLRTTPAGPDSVRANVTFSDPPGPATTVRLDLVRSSGRWKIHDVGAGTIPSLLTYLRTYKY